MTSIPSPTVGWEQAAGGNTSFEVASVKRSRPDAEPTTSFPLGPGDVFAATGGRFCATGQTTINYIGFAYKLSNQQLQKLSPSVPGWVTADRFDIEARGSASANKDQMRLMMQSLLAERFALKLHRESVRTPAFGLVSTKKGIPGPRLKSHPAGASCSPPPASTTLPSPTKTSTIPETQFQEIPCGGILALPPSAPGRLRIGARNVPLSLLAAWMTNALTGVDRPVADHTDFVGNFDFDLEFSPVPNPAQPGLTPDPNGLLFGQALQEELGLKLESITGTLDVVVVDQILHPTEN